MTERTGSRPAAKARSQDIAGFLFCAVGGFFAVSISLALFGWESKGGAWTWPVEELLALLGPWAALFLGVGVALLGSVLFLHPREVSPSRPLAGLVGLALGLALLLGARGGSLGGDVGSALPGLWEGFAGGALAVLLGLSLLWVSLRIGFIHPKDGTARRAKPARQPRIEPDADLEAADGVSAAEAALLVSEPRKSRPAPSPGLSEPLPREDVRTLRPAPPSPQAPRSASPAPPARPQPILRDEFIRPLPPPASPATPVVRRVVAAPSVAPEQHAGPDLAEKVEPVRERETERRPVRGNREHEARPAQGSADAGVGTGAQDASRAWEPAWVANTSAPGATEETWSAAETRAEESSEPGASAPSWEQVGLFDEEEARTGGARHEPEATVLEAPLEANGDEAGELEDALDEVEEDELEEEDEEDDEDGDDEEDEDENQVRDESEEVFVLEPAVAGAADEEQSLSDEWEPLVFDAGCLILEQNRVAVSMIERRFEIDFDRACEVLDRLQKAGLIGPYMGGRTRDILLSREEWLAHAPHGS